MKKILGLLILCLVLFVGCGTGASQNQDIKKQSRVEVYSAEDELLIKTLDNQDTIARLLGMSGWETIDVLPGDLSPQYKLLVYQEKTLLLGQDPKEEREYELIETLTTFENSSYVEDVLSENVMKGKDFSVDSRTFYYVMPDDVIIYLNEQLK